MGVCDVVVVDCHGSVSMMVCIKRRKTGFTVYNESYPGAKVFMPIGGPNGFRVIIESDYN